jgi:nucleoside-diphosphate-sugar epimerase
MRILVTGGAGFVGSMLVPELLKEGHEVTVLDTLTWGMQGLSVNFGKPGFDFVKGDVRNDKLISSLLEKKDAVVHLAALVGYGLCESNKKQATDVNVNGTRTIDNYLSDDQLLIYASTGSVYGQANGSSCTEETAPNPPSHYAITKLEGEKIFAKRNNVVTLRFATAFGVSFRMRLDLLVNQLVYEAIKHKVVVVYGKNFVRSVIHVKDMARSILFAVHNRELMQGQTFNVSSSELSFTKEQIAYRIKKQVDFDIQFADANELDGRNYNLSAQKLGALGYRTSISLDQGIMEIICAVNKLKIEKTYFNSR